MKIFKIKYVQNRNIRVTRIKAESKEKAKLIFYMTYRNVEDILNIVEGDKDV